MKKMMTSLALAGLILHSIAAPVLAHHSFSAEFDRSKPIKLIGTVTKVDWTNPHIWFYIDVKDPVTGRTTNWALEMGSPNAVLTLGWTRSSLKIGDVVTVSGYQAKSGANRGNAVDVIMANGRKVLAGSSADSELPK